MSRAFGIFIATVVLANIGAVLWLIWWTARGSAKVAPEQTTHVWDDDLTEYNNPLPRWWLWLFLLSIVFGLCYLAWYPGLGNFAGLGHWTQSRQYDEEDVAARQSLEQRFAAFKGKSLTGAVEGSGGHGHRQESIRAQLFRLPRLRRARRQGISQSDRPGLAVGRQRGDGLSNHCTRPRRPDAGLGHRYWATMESRT